MTLQVHLYGFWYHGVSFFIPFLLLTLISFRCLRRVNLAPLHMPSQFGGILHPVPTFLTTASSFLLLPAVTTQSDQPTQHDTHFSQQALHAWKALGNHSWNIFLSTFKITVTMMTIGSGTLISPVIIICRIFSAPRQPSIHQIHRPSNKVGPRAANAFCRSNSQFGCSQMSSMYPVPFLATVDSGQVVFASPH